MKVSAIMPAYNAEKTIARAIDSILNQSFAPYEIIVVDDGSKDETLKIVSSFGHRVRLIRQPNEGAAAARNKGINEARGNWIAFLDADDYWLPHRLKSQVDIIKANQDLVWCCGNFLNIDAAGNTYVQNLPESLDDLLNGSVFGDYFQAWIRYSVPFWTCSFLIQKNVFKQIGFFRTYLTTFEDQDLWLRIAYSYPKIGYVKQPICVYDRSQSTLTKGSKNVSVTADALCEHYKLAKHSNNRYRKKTIESMFFGFMHNWVMNNQGEQVRRALKNSKIFLSNIKWWTIISMSYIPMLFLNKLRAMKKYFLSNRKDIAVRDKEYLNGI